MKPYIKAYELAKREADREMWHMGHYICSAVGSTVSLILGGDKTKAHYLESPIMESVKNGGELTEEEKMKELKRFEAQQTAMRLSWRAQHRTEAN